MEVAWQIFCVVSLVIALFLENARAKVPGPRPGHLEEGECGDFNKDVDTNMEITSPNYPEAYPNRLSCEMVIKARPGYVTRLYFLDFQIEPSQNCWLDRLEIYLQHEEPTRGKSWYLASYFCGSDKPTLVLSAERMIKLHFQTDRYTTYKGFRAVLQYISAA